MQGIKTRQILITSRGKPERVNLLQFLVIYLVHGYSSYMCSILL